MNVIDIVVSMWSWVYLFGNILIECNQQFNTIYILWNVDILLYSVICIYPAK